MKNSQLILGALLASASLSARADAPAVSPTLGTSTYVSFIDTCTGNEVSLAPPSEGGINGVLDAGDVDLYANVQGADANTKIQFRLVVAPMGFVNNELDKQNLEEFDEKTDGNGQVVIKRKISLKKWRNKLTPTGVVANLMWHQKPVSEKSGGGSASIFLPAKKQAFRIISQAQCYWEGPVSVVSQYIRNEQANSEMALSREERLEKFVARVYGFGIGFGNSLFIQDRRVGVWGNPTRGDGMSVVFPSDAPVGFWVSDRWFRVFGTKATSSVEQKWYLHPADGGFFGSRYLFTRFKVEEYQRVGHGVCNKWQIKKTGMLDVGIPNETFYSVPWYMAGHPDQAQEYMENMRPALNTCGDAIKNGDVQFLLKGQTDDMMYFYPN